MRMEIRKDEKGKGIYVKGEGRKEEDKRYEGMT